MWVYAPGQNWCHSKLAQLLGYLLVCFYFTGNVGQCLFSQPNYLMRKSSDFPFITSKRPLLMSHLPFEQYRIIFKLIKTRQQYTPFLTQVSPRDSILTSLIFGPPLSNRERTLIMSPSGVGTEPRERTVCQLCRSAGVIGTISCLESF